MAELLSQDEIYELLDIADGVDNVYLENVNTIKYNGKLNQFYKSVNGYETEDEAKFNFYKEELEKLQLNIKAKQDDILRYEKIIDDIIKDNYNLFLKFPEEMLI